MNRNLSLFLMMILLAFTAIVKGQEKSVTGKVLDETGETLPGVTIQVEGSNTGTITNMDGTYNISLSADQNVLIFSFVGYTPQRIQVGNRTTIDVRMESDVVGLSEVVVVGYGTMRKSDLTGAISTVDVDKMKQLSTIDPLKAMQGRVSGVNITSNSGAPGSGTTVRIRGIGSLNGSNPLYIIDGFPTGDMSSVAPNDIESLEVLKDASSTAIYGARGANGVILVKTRSGRKEKEASISVNSYVGFNQLQKKLDLMNATEWATLFLESNENAGQTPSIELGAIADFVIANNYKGTDWQNELFQTALMHSHNVSISGGTEKHIYDIAGTFSNEEGIVNYSKMDKYLFRFNNQLTLRKKLNPWS